MTEKREKIDILGIPVDHVTMGGALSVFRTLLKTQGTSLIVTPNSEIVVNAAKDPMLKALIGSADLVIPDGIGLVYASRILKQPLSERVTGIDFTDAALGVLAEQGKSVFFFGAKPGVAAAAAQNKAAQIPGLKIAGTRHGYFREEEEPDIVREMNASGADFLCVALGSPKQELFIARHRAQLKASVAIGIGGSLDVWAGVLERAPDFYRKYGLEWLFRLRQEPSRIKRVTALPVFLCKVAIQGHRQTDRASKE